MIFRPITAKIGNITAKIGNITAKIGNITAQIGNITAKISNITAQIGNITAQIGNITAKIWPKIPRVAADFWLRKQRKMTELLAQIESSENVLFNTSLVGTPFPITYNFQQLLLFWKQLCITIHPIQNCSTEFKTLQQ